MSSRFKLSLKLFAPLQFIDEQRYSKFNFIPMLTDHLSDILLLIGSLSGQ